MDRPGEIDRDSFVPLAANAKWGVDTELSDEERDRVLKQLRTLVGEKALSPDALAKATKAGDFAILITRLLTQSSQP